LLEKFYQITLEIQAGVQASFRVQQRYCCLMFIGPCIIVIVEE